MLDGKWKLLISADGTGAELYDLLADAKESHNLADTEIEKVATMKAAALAWRKALPKLPPAP